MKNNNMQAKIWTKNFVVMVVVAFLMGVANNMFVGALPLYVMQKGGSSSIVGIVMSVFTPSALCCRHILGKNVGYQG